MYRNDQAFLALSAKRIADIQRVCFEEGMNFYVETHIFKVSEDIQAFNAIMRQAPFFEGVTQCVTARGTLCVGISFCLSVFPSVCLSVRLSVRLPPYLLTYLPTYYLPTYLPTCQPVNLSTCLPVNLSTCQSVYLAGWLPGSLCQCGCLVCDPCVHECCELTRTAAGSQFS